MVVPRRDNRMRHLSDRFEARRCCYNVGTAPIVSPENTAGALTRRSRLRRSTTAPGSSDEVFSSGSRWRATVCLRRDAGNPAFSTMPSPGTGRTDSRAKEAARFIVAVSCSCSAEPMTGPAALSAPIFFKIFFTA
jgi:hypothetical protein